MMKHKIDPMVDCVAKAIFSSKSLLVHFLNATLQPATPIVDIRHTNTHNDRNTLRDKATVVDFRGVNFPRIWKLP